VTCAPLTPDSSGLNPDAQTTILAAMKIEFASGSLFVVLKEVRSFR
jgi:hypothetical protein